MVAGTGTGMPCVETHMMTNDVNHSMPTSTDRSASPGLSRRSLLMAALGAPALAALVAACGDDTKQSDPTTADTTNASTGDTSGGTTAPTTGAIDHPTGADEMIFRFGYVGGFTTVGVAFTSPPSVLVTGDGRLITPGVTTAIYPGPLLPALSERTITEAGIQKLLALADTAGLLATPPDYSGNILVADAADTLVVIHANGETFTHQAPALGFEEPDESDARKALRTFTDLLGDIAAVVGAENLGEEAPLVAESYRVQAMVVTDEELASIVEPAPTVVDWPLADLSLAGAAECLVVPADRIGSALTDASQITFFRDGTVADSSVAPNPIVYRVSAIALLPGDVC